VIWSPLFEERLQEWRDLRDQAAEASLDVALASINDWWWRSPMVNQTLTWQEFPNWPDAWSLLAQQSFCDLARALGMSYTVLMLHRDDIQDLYLLQTPNNNLVQINKEKYILNWSPGVVLNNLSPETVIKRSLSSKELEKFIG